ncbi:proximal sequence element A Pbp49 isoform 1-T4 [Glossina fuscipes fuscipes]
MEDILGQAMRPPINLKEFLKNYQDILKPPYTLPVTDIKLQKSMKLLEDHERFQEAEENCSLEILETSDDARITDFIPGFTELPRKSITELPTDALPLRTVTTLLKLKENTQKNPFQRSTDIYSLIKLPTAIAEKEEYTPGQELKIYIRVYRPARATHEHRTLEKPVLAEEFECLGSNFLTELRDKIQCVCNHKRFFDISENPEAPLPSKETEPGYFFITDTFYNDKRNPLNADYSTNIREWARSAKGLQNVKFKTALMEETRFIDLTVSLGFPQHYQHHGNCEHVFVFSQLEVIATPATQMLPRHYYPRLKSYSHFNNRLCNTCGNLHFVYVVEGSNRQVHDPAYMCKKCFLSYHYIDGKKVGQFRAYRLIDCNNESEEMKDEGNPAGSTVDVDSMDNLASILDGSYEEEDDAEASNARIKAEVKAKQK